MDKINKQSKIDLIIAFIDITSSKDRFNWIEILFCFIFFVFCFSKFFSFFST